MAYNSAHTGPEIDAAVQLLGEIQEAKNSTDSDRQAVAGMAATVATQAAQVSSQAGSVSSNTAVVLASASAVDSDRAEVEQNTALALNAKDAAEDAQSEVLAAKEVVEIIQSAVSNAQVAVDLSEQNAGDSASSARSDREIVEALAIQTADDRTLAAESAAAAAAVVTGGTATLQPEPGKIPLAKGDGRIDEGWLPSAIARTSALTEISEKADLATATSEATESRTARYLAPAAVAPGHRDDGLPLQTGDVYFNTADQTEYRYENGGWRSNDSIQAIEALEATIAEQPGPGLTPKATNQGTFGLNWIKESDLKQYSESFIANSSVDTSVNDDDFFTASRPDGALRFSALNVWNYIKAKVYNLIGSISVDFSSFSGIDLTGATDSTAGLQSALNSGVTRFTGKGIISSGPITLPIGVVIDGNDQLTLRYIGAAGGDFFTFIDAASGFKQLSGIRYSRITITVSGGKAVVTPRSANAWNRQYRFDFAGLQACDNDTSLTIANNYWAIVLNVGDCRQFRLNRYSFIGGWRPTDTDGITHACKGLVFSSAVGAIGVSIYDGSCTSMSRAWDLSDGVEGHEIHGNEAVSCWEGLMYTNATEEPGGFVYGNHFNCSKTCIGGSKRVELNIGPNSYYRSSAMAVHSAGWSAVDLSECNYKVTIGAIHAVPGSAIALANSYAIRLTNCAATFLRIQDFDVSLQMTGAVLLDSVSGLRMQGGSARGMNEFCRVLNTYFNTTDVKMMDIDASNTDATLLVLPAGFAPTGIYMQRAPRGPLNSPASLPMNNSGDFTIQPKAGLTTTSFSATGINPALVLSKVGASAGDKVQIKHVNASAAGSTVRILNGAGGSVLNTIPSGNSNRYLGEYEFNGTNWVCNYLVLDLDATLRT